MKEFWKDLWGKFRSLPIKMQMLAGGMVLFCVVVGFAIGFEYTLVALLCLFLFSFAGNKNKEEQDEEWKWSDLKILKGTRIQKWTRDEKQEARQGEQEKIMEEIRVIEEHIEAYPNDLQAKLLLKEKMQQADRLKK